MWSSMRLSCCSFVFFCLSSIPGFAGGSTFLSSAALCLLLFSLCSLLQRVLAFGVDSRGSVELCESCPLACPCLSLPCSLLLLVCRVCLCRACTCAGRNPTAQVLKTQRRPSPGAIPSGGHSWLVPVAQAMDSRILHHCLIHGCSTAEPPFMFET